ncbi:MAG: prephenate dehydrogenase/arogenate dehydrogenase family protein [Candidatus Omnitrophica bacterium]|nr:prephenate dehydrogenase/arogenate dehydrogenase family protein [Candidatus Omnitrophota bacterium]
MKIKKIAIIGMGLIGGSVGKALIEKKLADEVVGICRRESSLDRAVREKSLTKGFVNNYGEALLGAEIILIATPVSGIKNVLKSLSEVINDTKILVSDAGSTKKEIVDYAAKFKDKFSFIGAHPLAGSEKSGVESSSSDLFEDSVCILTPPKDASIENCEKLKNLWESIGAVTHKLSPEEHDKNIAFSSHLPHVAAYALVGSLPDEFAKNMVASGFKDTTRIASSDPELWKDIFMSNKDNVIKAITRFKETLDGLEADISTGRAEELKVKLKKMKEMRDNIV